MKNDNPKHNRRAKSIVILVSTLVLLIGMVGGTLAYLAARTNEVVNEFTFGDVTPTIPEEIHGNVKSNVCVTNTGNTTAFVRAKIVITWKDASGNVNGKFPVEGQDYSMALNKADWFARDGYWYCKAPVAAGKTTAALITEAKKLPGAVIPEGGYDLSIEILAQTCQADGTTADGAALVTTIWPVTVVNGQLQ